MWLCRDCSTMCLTGDCRKLTTVLLTADEMTLYGGEYLFCGFSFRYGNQMMDV